MFIIFSICLCLSRVDSSFPFSRSNPFALCLSNLPLSLSLPLSHFLSLFSIYPSIYSPIFPPLSVSLSRSFHLLLCLTYSFYLSPTSLFLSASISSSTPLWFFLCVFLFRVRFVSFLLYFLCRVYSVTMLLSAREDIRQGKMYRIYIYNVGVFICLFVCLYVRLLQTTFGGL